MIANLIKQQPAMAHVNPSPTLGWSDGPEMWNFMLEKDASYSKLRSERILDHHPSLDQNHRTILLDWISEVSHELKFHRETYQLALDFIDRYLASQTDVGRNRLQLIGTTCLFLAAKYEEIRPPTVNEFADLTDGACRPDEIVDNEVIILSAINWDITPITPNSWLNTFTRHLMLNFDELKRIASLIDLAMLHIESLRFSSSILTASAFYYFTSEQAVRKCSGFTLAQLSDCIHWLQPFAATIKAIEGPIFMASCKGESHPTQMHTHIATAALLEEAIVRMLTARQQSLKRKACNLEDEDNEENLHQREIIPELHSDEKRRRNTHMNTHSSNSVGVHAIEVGTPSPLKPFTTALLTPPSSTSKSRRKRSRSEMNKLCSTKGFSPSVVTTTEGMTPTLDPEQSSDSIEDHLQNATNSQTKHVRSFAYPKAY